MTGLFAAGLLFVGAGVADASEHAPTAEAPAETCGYFPVAQYRHCDNGSGSTVMLDVKDIFFGIHHVCVRPGVTNLQPYSRWAVVDAWWNGGVGCTPGLSRQQPCARNSHVYASHAGM